jgi:hypothetical protein|tara:strand:- start:1434 stop:1664 length:231 start_codon:yes stop_codon:yes gene_type:complete
MGLSVLTKDVFAQSIEKIVKENNSVAYVDAILMYCEANQVEIEVVAKLINPKIKATIEKEASDLNMLKYKLKTLEF